MAKTKINYVCTQCGAIQPKWMGKCPDCGSWNTLVENVEAPISRFASSAVPQTAKSTVQKLEQIDSSEEQRYLTQMEELNRVLGGGIVPGSVVLLSGDPGIGKSTLLLQICQPSRPMHRCYIYPVRKACGRLNYVQQGWALPPRI